jgi:hypothetical protein
VIEDVAQVTAIDPAATGGASDEVLGVITRGFPHSIPEDGGAGNV